MVSLTPGRSALGVCLRSALGVTEEISDVQFGASTFKIKIEMIKAEFYDKTGAFVKSITDLDTVIFNEHLDEALGNLFLNTTDYPGLSSFLLRGKQLIEKQGSVLPNAGPFVVPRTGVALEHIVPGGTAAGSTRNDANTRPVYSTNSTQSIYSFDTVATSLRMQWDIVDEGFFGPIRGMIVRLDASTSAVGSRAQMFAVFWDASENPTFETRPPSGEFRLFGRIIYESLLDGS